MIIVALGFGGNLVERLRISRLNYGLKRFTFDLESTDAAPEVLHRRLTRLPACRSASAFFFFFLGFAPTWLDSRRCGSIHAESALIRTEPG